jgi:predicted ATPase/DNA-binding winged helix-turn-helix (wHTH) protein
MQMLQNAPFTSSGGGAPQPLRAPIFFGRLTLHPMERRLECDGLPVRISSRAFDILHALLEQPGEVVPNRELIARAWPGICVEDANLRVHIAALRSIISSKTGLSRCITNVPSRGYALTMPGSPSNPQSTFLRGDISQSQLFCQSAGVQRLVGRDQDLALLRELVCTQALVNIVGMGGMGKTLLALRLLDELRSRFAEAYFVDVSRALTAQDLISSLSKLLKCSPDVDAAVSALHNRRDRDTLIVLDTCEHMVEPVADLCSRLQTYAPEVRTLLTSRTSTRAPSERVHMLRPLQGASQGSGMPDAQLELFLAAAEGGGYRSEITDEERTIAGSICRRLDGNPLAIEIIASRAASHGIEGTSILTENAEWVLTQTHRGTEARHRTISVMLDWSYQLLGQSDRKVLGFLSEIGGPFALIDAERATENAQLPECEIQLSLSRLLELSFVSCSVIDGDKTYRVPNIVKLFTRMNQTVPRADIDAAGRQTSALAMHDL